MKKTSGIHDRFPMQFRQEKGEHSMSRRLGFLLEHPMPCLMALALIGLTVLGVGDACHVASIALPLCLAGLFQRPGCIDRKIMGDMLIYLFLCALSALLHESDITASYAAAQAMYPLLYLLMGGLEKRELLWLRRFCALWAAYVAANGIVQFLLSAMDESAGRLGGMLGNPNSLGIFMVVAWFGLTAWMPEREEKGPVPVLLRRLEPLLLTALAMSLSMGSFFAMAVGIAVRGAGWRKQLGWRRAAEKTACVLAKCALCIGAGILMYCMARYTSTPWLCIALAVWLLILTAEWETFERFLGACRWFPWAMCVCGCAMAPAAMAIRPSAAATFVERLHMMRNGWGYLLQNPLRGVGPYQWRLLNLYDGDTYYNTWYIHNVLLHIGVENGLPAMTMAILVVLRTLQKRGRNLAGFTAYLFHNLMDTSFFYNGVTAMTLFTVGEPDWGGAQLSPAAHKLFCAVFGLLFVFYRFFAPAPG